MAPFRSSQKFVLPAPDDLANRLDRAVVDGVALLALTIDERAIILGRSKIRPKDSASYAV